MSAKKKITPNGKQRRIAFQGEIGANSDLACRQAYPSYTPVPCLTFEDAFDEVHSARADLAMIPIENSVAGRVADVHHLMLDSNLSIIAEFFMPIRHHLLAPKGASLNGLKTVESHVQALGQCHKFLRKHNLVQLATADTAKSAREVAESKDTSRAAIAPPLAGELYGLQTIAADIQDVMYNTTRFVVLAREAKWAPRGKRRVMTTFIFQVRNIPGALYKALGGFATNGVNMTKLESYMVGGNFFATQFYADVEGHPDDPNLKLALDELAFFSKERTILGVYPAHRLRDKLGKVK
jgi:prephenate dehydratase